MILFTLLNARCVECFAFATAAVAYTYNHIHVLLRAVIEIRRWS